MVPGTGAWEEEYTKKGVLWSGVPRGLPELPAGSRVLELGCGNGKALAVMMQRGWNVTALDPSVKAVVLSKKLATSSPAVEVMVADARTIPVKSSSFDAVFAIHVIGHVHKTDRQEIAREVTRVLKPGGIVFFCDFSTRDFRYGKGHATEPSTVMRGTKIITHYFTREEVMDLFLDLTCRSLMLQEWSMRIRGNDLLRSEVTGVFTK